MGRNSSFRVPRPAGGSFDTTQGTAQFPTFCHSILGRFRIKNLPFATRALPKPTRTARSPRRTSPHHELVRRSVGAPLRVIFFGAISVQVAFTHESQNLAYPIGPFRRAIKALGRNPRLAQVVLRESLPASTALYCAISSAGCFDAYAARAARGPERMYVTPGPI